MEENKSATHLVTFSKAGSTTDYGELIREKRVSWDIVWLFAISPLSTPATKPERNSFVVSIFMCWKWILPIFLCIHF